ncbi:hypothetical protein BH11PAT4_BH11PAT4_1250 [soil metagenome]
MHVTMTIFRKVVSAALSVSTALALTGFNLATPVLGSQLKNASVTLSDPRPSQSGVSHTISFAIATGGNFGGIKFLYSNTASGTSVPTSLSTAAAAVGLVTIPGADTGNWGTPNVSTLGTIIIDRTTQATVSTNDVITFRIDGMVNSSQAAACDAITNSDSCWIQITTYSDVLHVVPVDTTTTTYTVTDSVTVSATVDPILTFTVAGVASGSLAGFDSNAGAGTAVTSTSTTLPFGNVTVGTAKMAMHQLNTQTNANSGYFVYGKFITSTGDVMNGTAVPANNIDKFTASSASWASPQTWAAPTGTAANVNSAWIGVRTTDTDISGFNVSNRYGPPDVLGDSGSGKAVMSSTTPDNGTTPHYVTYKIQANAFQPADLYVGTWVYNVVASY